MAIVLMKYLLGRYRQTTLYCFSPPVMLATFLIEICLLIYVIARHGFSSLRAVLVSASLLLLAVFQLAEYNVCGRFNIDALAWSRIGFVAITLLPPLGLHLVQTILGKPRHWLSLFSYITAAVWVYIFGFSALAFQSHECAGNYAIFQLEHNIGYGYFMYYYGWLLLTIGIALHALHDASTRAVKRPLQYMILGYALFLIPTTALNVLMPHTTSGIPSIMCGFAILYAFILVFGVLPKPKTPIKRAEH